MPPTPDPAPDPAAELSLQPAQLKGIAHPLRVRLLGLLRVDGPSTATRLAERVGESSGSTSYHLRQLAAYGFITPCDPPQDEPRGAGSARERWWRAAHRFTRFAAPERAPGEELGEADVLAEEYLRSVATVYHGQVLDWLSASADLPAPWHDAGALSDITLRLTREQCDRLRREMGDLVRSYDREHPADAPDARADSERVVVQWQVLPFPRGGRR
jgi:DNA-binding transcriptional ArsR family regulator